MESYVKDFQRRLRRIGVYTGKIDGIFGQATAMCTRVLRVRDVSKFGKFPCKRERSGTDTEGTHWMRFYIKEFQHKLRRMGLYTWNIDGIFGPKTVLVSRLLITEEIYKFGEFSWEDGDGGRIIQEKNWFDENIIKSKFPVFGEVLHHRQLTNTISGIALDIYEEYKMKENPIKFDGCWVPRYKFWSPSRTLSLHSWGIAIDLNPKENPHYARSITGTAPMFTSDHPVVKIFKAHGWFWGGDWKDSQGKGIDPMHFQAIR